MSKKILEIRGEDWMKGLSYHTTLQYGGIFQIASKFDPFKRVGLMSPTPTPVQDTGAGKVAKIVRHFATGQVSGLNYLFSWADNGTAPSLYKTLVSTGATTDESASVTVTNSSARGIIVYGGYIIYARNTEIRSVTLALTGDTQILTTNVTSAEHPFTIGADKNLYFPNVNYVGKIDGTTGLAATTGNDARAFTMEADLTIRHLVNDGRYLVIIADNAGTATTGKANCVIGFWDYTSTTLTQRFDFQEAGLTGGVYMDGAIYVFGKDYIYVTNVGTFPKAIHSFLNSTSTITATYPTSPAQLSQQGNSIYWASTATASVYAYGSLVSGGKKVFYSPYGYETGVSAFIQISNLPYAGTTDSKLYSAGLSPATNATATIKTSAVTLPVPYKFDWARVVMRSPLASGQSVGFSMNTQAGIGAITGTSTFSFASHGAKQTYTFRPSGGGSTITYFEDFYMTLSSNATVEKIEIWGTEGDPQQEQI